MRISVSVFPAKHCQHRFAWVFLGGVAKGARGRGQDGTDPSWTGLSSEQCEHHVDSVISWSLSECAERDLALPNFCVLSFAAALNIHAGQIRFCFCFCVFFGFSCVLYQNIINKFACWATMFFITAATRRRFYFFPFSPNFLIKCTNGHISAVGGYFPNLKLHFMLECRRFLRQLLTTLKLHFT